MIFSSRHPTRPLKGSWNGAANFILSLQLHRVWTKWVHRGHTALTSVFLEILDKEDPSNGMECRLNYIYKMCYSCVRGWCCTSDDCFRLGFLLCSGHWPPNTSTAITALTTWKHRRPGKERVSFPQTFLNPDSDGHHTLHWDFLSQSCLYWQDSPLSLTST